MIAPILRMVQTALEADDFGLAYYLGRMEADEDDMIPKCPTIINSADTSAAVSPQSSSANAVMDWPLLVLTCEDIGTITMSGVVGQDIDVPNLQVLGMYITGETMDLAQAGRDADYTGRAILHALSRSLFGSDRSSYRTKGKILIMMQNTITYAPADHKLTQGRVAGVFTLDLRIRVSP